jgi:ADP-ribose pyrophosphatase YjhB (NUDIX family)
VGLAGRLGRVLPVYAKTAWWGLVQPHTAEREPLVVHQGVVLSERGVLLSVRSDLHGWELPGGNAEPGESGEDAVRREILEETGVGVEVERLTGEYRRTGFRPHTACVYRCRADAVEPRPSRETPRVAWFPLGAVPGTLFPWYRGPLTDAVADLSEPVRVEERWGLAAIAAGMWIDLRMRLTDHRAD